MRLGIIIFAVFAAILLSMFSAQSLPDPCYQMYRGGLPQTFSILRASSTYSGLLSFSLLIILSVLAIVAVLYAIGTAFQIGSLIAFSKNEILENVLNFIIIIFISGGIIAVDSLVSGLAQFGTYAIGGPAPTIQSLTDLYSQTCEIYYSDAIGQIWYLMMVSLYSVAISAFSNLQLLLMPNGFGVILQPFAWFGAFLKMVGLFGAVAIGIAGIEIVNVFLLSIIYYLFPLFLYLGIIFRSFPWTRPLGGAFLGVFVSFYVFYPALTFAISYITQTITPNVISSANTQLAKLNLVSFLQLSPSVNIGYLPEQIFSIGISSLVDEIVCGGINVIGILISLVICFDLVEAFGDLLGAPSLSHGDVLKKVI
ncbi:MAG: hypothetical protein ACP5HF_00090 [Candidatus Micrarchaeia archaeon]